MVIAPQQDELGFPELFSFLISSSSAARPWETVQVCVNMPIFLPLPLRIVWDRHPLNMREEFFFM